MSIDLCCVVCVVCCTLHVGFSDYCLVFDVMCYVGIGRPPLQCCVICDVLCVGDYVLCYECYVPLVVCYGLLLLFV